MTVKNQANVDSFEFQQDYQNYLSSSEDMDRLLSLSKLCQNAISAWLVQLVVVAAMAAIALSRRSKISNSEIDRSTDYSR